MKRKQFEIGDWQDGQRRLDHYNEWLMDPTREFGKPYPGYPEDSVGDKNDSYLESTESVETVQSAPVSSGKKSNKINKLQHRKVTVAFGPKVSHNKQTENLKGNDMSKVTKLSQATEIVKAAKSKQEALADIQNALGVSKSNAFVYFTKASKILGSAPATEKAPKAEKVAKAKVNPVTETSPEKVKAKVAEIDKVIAGLKANGAKVASPFAALGA